jgi:hypothetical protein
MIAKQPDKFTALSENDKPFLSIRQVPEPDWK